MRALRYGGADDPQHADDAIVIFAMIETAQAPHKLDESLGVAGPDAIYIGPSDLSLALGCRPAFDDVDPPVVEAIAHDRRSLWACRMACEKRSMNAAPHPGNRIAWLRISCCHRPRGPEDREIPYACIPADHPHA